MIQKTQSSLLDSCDHTVKHFISLKFIFHLRISLSVSLQADTLTELIHIVNMIHPFLIDNFQKDHTLQLTKLLCFRKLRFFFLVKLYSLFFQLLFHLVFLHTLDILTGNGF